jgi:hypothetical protein
MQQPAIQAALDNLVEVIRTALTAEFLEYFRDGEAKPVRGKSKQKATKSKQGLHANADKNRAVGKKVTRRVAK